MSKKKKDVYEFNKMRSISAVKKRSIHLLMLLPVSISFLLATPHRAYHSSSLALSSSRQPPEDVYAAVHRKEYEMRAVKSQHKATTDPVRIAMSYGQESVSTMRLAKALRRVYEDKYNPANPNAEEEPKNDSDRKRKLEELGMAEMSMRRASFVVDIKRRSLSRPGETFCRFDNAAMVAEAMVRLGADVVMVNVDYKAYGGDITELKSAVKAVRKASKTAAVVMKGEQS